MMVGDGDGASGSTATTTATTPPVTDGRAPPDHTPPNMSSINDRKIFIGGLLYATTDDRLLAHFSQYGDILEAVVIYDRNTGRSKGYGFVTFASAEGAARATEDPNPHVDGRKTNCNLSAQRRQHRPYRRHSNYTPGHHMEAMKEDYKAQMYASYQQQLIYAQSYAAAYPPPYGYYPGMYHNGPVDPGHLVNPMTPEEHQILMMQQQPSSPFFLPMGPVMPMSGPPPSPTMMGGFGYNDDISMQLLVQNMGLVSLDQHAPAQTQPQQTNISFNLQYPHISKRYVHDPTSPQNTCSIPSEAGDWQSVSSDALTEVESEPPRAKDEADAANDNSDDSGSADTVSEAVQ